MLLVAWEAVLLGGKALIAWETSISTRGIALSSWEAWETLSLADCLPAWEELAELLPSVRSGGIASFLGIVATFSGRSAVRGDHAGFLGSSAVLGKVATCLPVMN